MTGAPRKQPLIELRSVSLAYGRSVAVRDVNLHVWPQELLVILGESGSGKTTLLKTINRLLRPDTGEVLTRATSIQVAVDVATGEMCFASPNALLERLGKAN